MQLRRDKKRDAVGRPSCRSSFLRDPGAEFFGRKLNKQKNSLNFASTCLKVVDNCRLTRCRRVLLPRSPGEKHSIQKPDTTRDVRDCGSFFMDSSQILRSCVVEAGPHKSSKTFPFQFARKDLTRVSSPYSNASGPPGDCAT